MRQINTLILHHTDSPRDTTTIEQIEKWHKARGFKTVGYNQVITGDGQIHNTRMYSEIPAACLGHNADSINVALTGDFIKEEPSEAQLQTLKELIEYIKEHYNNIPVYGHKEMEAPGYTECPGKLMEIIRGRGFC